MEELPVVFEKYSIQWLKNYPNLKTKWETLKEGNKKRLTIFKEDDSGFDVTVECETYGLYPFAEGWHGAAWDIVEDGETLVDLCARFMEFIRSLLCPNSIFEVFYADRKPYKWVLKYPIENRIDTESVSLIFYNYFAKRSKKVFQNNHLPSIKGAKYQVNV